MSSFLDKAKEKAQQLGTAAKEKADDIKDKRKADDLLDDLGRIVFAQRTNRGGADDETKITTIVDQLKTLEAEGTAILGEKPASNLPPPTA
ncbi:MAG: hypothetical protein Q7V57_04095 [Actinomycetota bacterium]|nr:hypothetical protein [Actinomycetota bacterium]